VSREGRQRVLYVLQRRQDLFLDDGGRSLELRWQRAVALAPRRHPLPPAHLEHGKEAVVENRAVGRHLGRQRDLVDAVVEVGAPRAPVELQAIQHRRRLRPGQACRTEGLLRAWPIWGQP